MTTTVQIEDNQIIINGSSLDKLIAEAVKTGVQEVLNAQKEDPLEVVTVQDLATQYGCTIKTMSKKLQDCNIRTHKVGKYKCIFKKDKSKIFKAA